MGNYNCEKYAKTFSQKSQYDKHLIRKNHSEIQTDNTNTLIEKTVQEKLISNNTENISNININKEMDLFKSSKSELLEKCKEMNITKYSSKNKSQLIEIIHSKQLKNNISCLETTVKNNEIIIPINENISSECKIINYIDLCCGIGGFRIALERFQKKKHTH